MHPAYSVIFFTTMSGAGYGLLIWLALTRLSETMVSQPQVFTPLAAVLTGMIALILVSAGLLSSMAHLGHPERAWRALSQWRSSWLSREGVAALVSYAPALILIASWWPGGFDHTMVQLAAWSTLIMSIMTVACTGMIYASLKTIPRWSNRRVVPLYLLFSLASGGLLFALALSGSGGLNTAVAMIIAACLMMAWILKWLYWRFIDDQVAQSTTGSATGLGRFGEVRQLESPHTSENYLLKEMGYTVARKHAKRLRAIALVLGLLIPIVLIILAQSLDGLLQIFVLSVTLLMGFVGIVIERWLFFAQARHAVTLFYGRSL